MTYVLLALVLVLVIFLITRKKDRIYRMNPFTSRDLSWEEKTILAAQIKRDKRNQRRIRENNPMAVGSPVWKAISRIK